MTTARSAPVPAAPAGRPAPTPDQRRSDTAPTATQDGATQATPLYFGPDDRPLFGWVHQPADGLSRGTAILCQPLLRQYISAHYTFRMLAEALAARGITAIRFDYDGTGDSAGEGSDPGRIAAALASVGHAVDLAHSLSTSSDATPLAFVGMRMGALLAARAAETSGPVSGLVLWDPCGSGREFLREQSALFRLLYGKKRTADGSTEVAGFVLTPDTTEELTAFTAPASLPDVARALILDRSDRPASGSFGVDESRIDRRDAAGQAELMDVEPFLSDVPAAAIDDIAGWLDDVFPAERVVQHAPARRTAMTVRSSDGSLVTERLVAIGPHSMFGVATSGPDEATGPTVFFLNSGRDPHTGPNRMWVELSRDWAARGFPTVRFDMTGLGDSPVRPGQPSNVVRAPEAFDDVVDALDDAMVPLPSGPASQAALIPAVLVGLCAGAYQALESAIDLHPVSVLSINPLLRFTPPEISSGPLDPRRRFAKPVGGNLRSAYRALPSWKVLKLVRRAYLALARIRSRQRSPLDWMEETAAKGTDILCICGEEEAAPFFEGAQAGRTTLDEPHCKIELIEDLDHGLMLAQHRSDITTRLGAHIASFLPDDVAPHTAAESSGAGSATPSIS